MWLPPVRTSTPHPKSSRTADSVIPVPPAAFSPFATTRSRSRREAIPARNSRTALRPGLPTTSPRKRTHIPAVPPALPRVFHGPRLPDDGDANLAGVRQLRLDLLGDVPREHRRRVVAHLDVVDDDAHLAARLDGVRLLDPREGFRDPLQVLEPLEVVREHLAPRSGPSPGESVRGLDEDRQDVVGRLVLVMRGDRVDDAGRLAVLLAQVGP